MGNIPLGGFVGRLCNVCELPALKKEPREFTSQGFSPLSGLAFCARL